MDIVKELKEIQSNNNFQEIIEVLESERNKVDQIKTDLYGKIVNNHKLEEKEIEQYNKKIHIFKVLEIKNTFDELYRNGSFGQYNINKVEIYYADLVTELKFSILFWSDEQFIKKQDANLKTIEPVNRMQNLASRLVDFSIEYLNDNFKDYDMLSNKSLFLDVNEFTSNNIQNLLLSDELQSILDSNINYMNLKKDLSVDESNNIKKIKL